MGVFKSGGKQWVLSKGRSIEPHSPGVWGMLDGLTGELNARSH